MVKCVDNPMIFLIGEDDPTNCPKCGKKLIVKNGKLDVGRVYDYMKWWACPDHGKVFGMKKE